MQRIQLLKSSFSTPQIKNIPMYNFFNFPNKSKKSKNCENYTEYEFVD